MIGGVCGYCGSGQVWRQVVWEMLWPIRLLKREGDRYLVRSLGKTAAAASRRRSWPGLSMVAHTVESNTQTVRSGYLDPAAPAVAMVTTGDVVSYPHTWTHWGNEATLG